MADKIIDPFVNIPYAELQPATNENAGGVFLSDLRTASVGYGDKVFRVDNQGMWFGAPTFAAAPFSVSVAGDVTASSITITGGTVKYGKTSFSDSTHAGYYQGAEGIYYGAAGDATKFKFEIATGAFDYVGTVSGRATSVLASAINASANLITDLINARMDTAAKNILSDFSFGVSGALQIGIYEAGVTGDIRITATGIAARDKNNQQTFALDATTGNATFSGTLTAAAGTLGTITAGTFTGVSITSSTVTSGIIRTATDGHQRISMSAAESTINIYWKDTSNINRASIGYDFDHSEFHIYVYDGADSSRDYVFDANSGAFYCAHNGQNLGDDTHRWFVWAEGINTYGHLNFIDQYIQSGSLTCDKYFTVQVRGTTYKVPCVAA